ncbi:hypothetical protein GCM10027037_10110 [Mucilaginibacter koreensis]
MMKLKEENVFGELGSTIGKGILAGLAGTLAISISQAIEMKITGREASEAPVKVASEVTGAAPANEGEKDKLSNEIHWAYGTAWGVARGLIGLTGLKGIPATLLHFGAVWGTEQVMLPKYDVAPPINEEEPKEIGIDVLHHAVYAIAAGLVYDALDAGSRRQKKVKAIMKKLHA